MKVARSQQRMGERNVVKYIVHYCFLVRRENKNNSIDEAVVVLVAFRVDSSQVRHWWLQS